MNNPFSILNQEGSDESVDSVDSVEFVHFESLVPDTKVKLPEQPFHEQVDRASTKSFFSQLTCSSKYGYFVAAGESGFLCGKTEQLYDTVYAAEKGDSISFGNCFQVPVKEGGIKFLVLSHDERQLIVGVTKGLLLIYHISDIVKERENTLAIRSISLDSEIISVHPNPEVYPDLVSVCVHNNGCKLVQITTGKIIHTIPYATSASWSPKGKQIVCGNKEGGIRAFDISGTVKDDIPAPQMANNLEVRALLWVENHIFLAIYGSTESPDAEHYPYIINRKALDENEKYQPLGEITPIYNSENADNQFYLSLIRDFGTDAKTMVIVANAIASDFAVIGQNANGTWQTWDFEEGRIPSLPLSENNLEDTFPVGIAVDFSASKNLPPFDASESDTPVPPMPIFLFLTNEGRICTYHIYCNSLAKNSERYSGMVNAEDVFSIQPPSDEPTDFTQMPSAPTPSSQQPSQPSQPVVGAFGAALNNSNKTPAFGNLANTKLPSFSGMRTTVPSIKPNTSAFGATQFQQPVFGAGGFGNAGAGVAQTSSFAALAKTSTQTSAGGGTFGNPPAFGSAFTTGNTPTFGSASTVGNTPTFGNVAAVGKIPPPAFGNAAITQQNPFGHFKSPTLGSAQQNPFGSFKNPALGNASTQQPAFGDVKKSAFTASSKFEDNQKEVPLATSAFASLNVKSPNVTHQTTPPTSSKYATHPTTEEIRNVSQPEPLSIESLSIDRGKENETTKQALVDDVQHEEKSREIHEPEHDLYVEEEKSEELTEDEQPYELDGLSDEEYDKEEYLEESDHLSEELSEEDFSNEYQSDGSEPLVTKQRSIKAKRKGKKMTKKRQEEETRLRQEEEEEEMRKRQAEEETRKRQAEEETRKRQAEEETRKRQAEEETRLRQEEEEEEMRKRQAEEETRKRQAEEEMRKRQAEEEMRKRQAEEEMRKRQAEEGKEIVVQQEPCIDVTDKTVEYKQWKFKRPTRTEVIPRFAELPKAAEEKPMSPRVLTAEHDISKKFENTYFETQDSIEATSKVLSDIQKDIDFHHVENSSLKQEEYLNSSQYNWRRGDTDSISNILIKLNRSIPEAKHETKALRTSVDRLSESIQNLVEQAEKLNGLSPEDTNNVQVKFKTEDLDDIKNIRMSVQYEELLKIAEAKTDSFESTISKYENRLKELKKKLVIVSVPNKPEKKLTTYTLRRTVRDCALSIRSAKSQIESLENALHQIHQKVKRYQDDGSQNLVKEDALSDKILEDQLQRQSLFSELFSSSKERIPLSSTYF